MPGKAHVIAIAIVGKSVFFGQNKWKTHPANYFSIHAEVDVLSRIPHDAKKKVILYVFRMLGTGELGMAKPCKKCRKYIKSIGVENVYYSNEEGQIIHERYTSTSD